MLLRTSSNTWRQLIKLDNIDACAVANGLNTIPLLDQFYKLFEKLINGKMPTKCPVVAGEHYVSNVTFKNDIARDIVSKTVTPSIFPNGIYRNFLRVSFPQDPGGLYMWNILEHSERYNEDTF